jgi:TonB family protein
MKYFSLILICCLLSISIFSQKISYGKSKYYVFLDEDYAELPDKTGATYVRVFLGVDSVKTTYEVRDYTVDGRLIFIANSSSKEYLLFEGPCTWFNSKRKPLTTGYYKNGQKDGIWTKYYENGQLKEQSEASEGKENIMNSWDSTGFPEVINGKGWYISRDDTTGIILETGKVLNGGPDGSWKYFTEKGLLKEVIVYSNGEFVKGTRYDEAGKPEDYKAEHIPPAYPGGDAALKRFLQWNLKYPREDQINGIAGIVVVQFIINAEGKMSKIVIHSGVSETLNREALRVVNLMPDWIPGRMNGKNVPVLFTLPISFTLHS